MAPIMTRETSARDWPGFAASWLVFLGLYLLFAGEVSAHELFAGVPTAAALAGFAVALRHAERRPLRLRPPWPFLLLRPVASVFIDSVRVGRVLLRTLVRRPAGPIGVIARQPFHEGGDKPVEAGRRGLVTLASSLAPNGYVLAIEPDTLVLHRLAPVPPASNGEWPL